MRVLLFCCFYRKGEKFLYRVDAVVRDIIRTYNDDFSLVHRRYQQFSSGEAYLRVLMERPVVVQSMQRQIYEVETERTVARSASIADEQVSLLWYLVSFLLWNVNSIVVSWCRACLLYR